MLMEEGNFRRFLGLLMLTCLGARLCPRADASGFAIPAQSASAAETAFAGTAESEDASVVWFNPAGMGRIDGTDLVTAGNIIAPSFKFSNTGSTGAFASPGTGDGGDGGRTGVVPEIYAVSSLGDRWHLGLGINSPFGLETKYPVGWRGQLTALRSEVKSYNINPSVAFKVNDVLSLAVGIDWQRFTADLTNFAGPVGYADLSASDSSWGYNLGAMFNITDALRIGISYRSSIAYRLQGSADFTAGNGIFNSNIQTDLTVPENAAVNGIVPLNAKWQLMANAIWTRWSRLENLTVVRTSSSAVGRTGSIVTELPFDWKDTYFFALGAAYQLNSSWKIQMGIGHDSAASNNDTRTPRLPDQGRTEASLGARYHLSSHSTFDLAYSHDFIKDADIDTAVAGVPGHLVGTFRNSANALSGQYSYRF
jgi:long-chain fatty acid transport protein